VLQDKPNDMAAFPPPEGMTEEDYDSIHAAVVETVRGRWFLAEYARRSRVDEVQEMLDAIGRLEKVVTSNKALPPPDLSPHLRLLAQRAEEIATRLFSIADDLRESGSDPYLCDDLDAQVRALVGLQKSSAASEPLVPRDAASESKLQLDAPLNQLADFSHDAPPGQPRESMSRELTPFTEPQLALMPAPPPTLPRVAPFKVADLGEDPRRAALAAIDSLPLLEKLALFS
jgi:hypothetical protein